MTNKHSQEILAQKIKAVPDYRHKSAAMLSQELGQCSERQMLRWVNRLIGQGLLEPRSQIGYESLLTVRRIQRYLAQHPGTVYLGHLAKAVYGAGNNYQWLRLLIEKAQAEGFEIDAARISIAPIPQGLRTTHRIRDGAPRFISMDEVDDEHLQAWIALMQSWYRLVPGQGVSHAA